jgi:hypothetical protein
MLSFLRVVFVASFFFIQGCGSGSSSDNEVSQPDTEYQFSLMASYINACGVKVPVTDVKLLLQNDNWQVLQSYQADIDGKIAFTTTSQYINYTIVTQDSAAIDGNDTGESANINGLDIVSFYHTLADSNYQYSSPFEPDNAAQECQCISHNLVLRHRSFATITQASSSIAYQSLESIDDQSTQFNQVKACSSDGINWPIATFMVSGVDDDGIAIGAGDFLTDFTRNEQGTWQLAAVEVANGELLPKQHDSFSHVQHFASGEHFSTQVAENSASTLVFDDHSYASESEYFSESVQLIRTTESVFGSSRFNSLHQKISTRTQDIFDVEAVKSAPEIDDRYYSEISSDGTYDYSAVKNYPMAIIAFDYLAYSPTTEQLIPVKWSSYGQESGLLPNTVDLLGYENIINQDSDIFNTKVELIRSLESDNYQDYLNFYQGIDNNNFDHNLLRYQLTLLLN